MKIESIHLIILVLPSSPPFKHTTYVPLHTHSDRSVQTRCNLCIVDFEEEAVPSPPPLVGGASTLSNESAITCNNVTLTREKAAQDTKGTSSNVVTDVA